MSQRTLKSDLIDLSVEVRHVTDRAVLVFDGANDVWLPLSQIECEPVDPITGTTIITLPEWLAVEKGLV